ncbi:MAG: sigma-70 family RNA polymerase sigma factor [Oscillospiraceae bacterium]|nr:sigma-70 family RNA polymerase sigma factor [Oscillospiraceae bacterium]
MDTISLKAGEGFEQVMEFYMPMVYRIAFARVGNREDAEDITQNVFLRYYKANCGFDSEEHRKAWLIRCAVNSSNTFAGSAWFRHRASDEGMENMSDQTEDFTEGTDRKSAVMQAVMRLPDKYRLVIHLFYFEDMSVSDISKMTKIRENTVRSQLSRAREMLKPMLKEVDFC